MHAPLTNGDVLGVEDILDMEQEGGGKGFK